MEKKNTRKLSFYLLYINLSGHHNPFRVCNGWHLLGQNLLLATIPVVGSRGTVRCCIGRRTPVFVAGQLVKIVRVVPVRWPLVCVSTAVAIAVGAVAVGIRIRVLWQLKHFASQRLQRRYACGQYTRVDLEAILIVSKQVIQWPRKEKNARRIVHCEEHDRIIATSRSG